ncbi:hypothetical protein M8818_004457 [Zalaria obscura]|uniref:Uncharacterized protein n=1 Tax=Zalaria obscura TaxID=2024903 RepID=A0ACC3SBV2_9PEZI
MPYLHHDGADLFFTAEGEGPAVLLLHGWTCDSHDFLFQTPLLLEAGYRVIALDQRGHGRSTAPNMPGGYEPEVLAADAIALLKHLDAAPAVVIGHSMGTIVASVMSIQHPEVVRALVLIECSYLFPSAAAAQIYETLQGDDAPEVAAATLAAVFYTPDTPAWIKTWHRRTTLAVPPHVVREAFAHIREGRPGYQDQTVELLRQRQKPRLAVYQAEESTRIERELGLEGVDEIKVIEGGSHWPHLQKPKEFNEILIAWLDQAGLLPVKN